MTVVPSDMVLPDLPSNLCNDLCLKLERDRSWVSVADFLINSGMSIKKDDLINQPSPAVKLLNELTVRLCTVEQLCYILRSSGASYALAVLCHPEPVQITTEPGAGAERMRVQFGGTLELECIAKSLPPPLYQWFRDNEQLSEANSSVLTIQDFSPELEGHYFCKVRADMPNSEEISSEEVEVTVIPFLSDIMEQPEGVNRQEGETVCLKCIIEAAYPVPSYEWYKGNQRLDNHTKSILYINYATPEDSGLYRCIVKNDAGEKESEHVTVQVVHTDIPVLKASERCTAKEKLALLIGNVQYSQHDCLVKPVDDVVVLAKKLTLIGFKVITLVNLRLVEMRNALRHFSHKLTPGVYGLFYYGGHGIQSEERLMLPVDAPKNYGIEHCLSEKEVKNMMLCRNPSLRVIILDMCLRAPDRPIHATFPQANVTDQPDIDLILAYSTSGNLSAYERRSEKNGTYIKYLSQYINEEITIMGVLQKTHEAIYNETIKMKKVTQQQIPMLLSNVFKKFCFTDQVTGDSDVESFFSKVYLPPTSDELDFNPSIDITPRPQACYCRYRDCILNAIEIEISGIDLDTWQINICSQKGILQMEDVPIKESRDKNVFRAVVEDLQGSAVAGNLSLTINLKDKQDCLIASTPLFLEKPLVANWFLWVRPEEP